VRSLTVLVIFVLFLGLIPVIQVYINTTKIDITERRKLRANLVSIKLPGDCVQG
jgi:hypothetical protein